MAFTPNPRGIAALARTSAMDRYLATLARAGAALVEQAAPSIVNHAGSRIYGEASGGVGRIVVQSHFWHLPEFGAIRYPLRPYIRPTAQRFFTSIGARLR